MVKRAMSIVLAHPRDCFCVRLYEYHLVDICITKISVIIHWSRVRVSFVTGKQWAMEHVVLNDLESSIKSPTSRHSIPLSLSLM